MKKLLSILTAVALTALSNINIVACDLCSMNKTNLNTIIFNKDLGDIYISTKDIPNKSDILKATIVGTNKYIGEVDIIYISNNFRVMIGTSDIFQSLTSDKNGNVYVGSSTGDVYRSDGTNAFSAMSGTSGFISICQVITKKFKLYLFVNVITHVFKYVL